MNTTQQQDYLIVACNMRASNLSYNAKTFNREVLRDASTLHVKGPLNYYFLDSIKYLINNQLLMLIA